MTHDARPAEAHPADGDGFGLWLRAIGAMLRLDAGRVGDPVGTDVAPAGSANDAQECLPARVARGPVASAEAFASRSAPARGAFDRLHLVMWEFEVRRGAEAAFEACYGSDGEWVSLLRRSPAYVRRELIQGPGRKRRYMVFDYWLSREHYAGFMAQCSAAYRHLEDACESLWEREIYVGDFSVLPPRHAERCAAGGLLPAVAEQTANLDDWIVDALHAID